MTSSTHSLNFSIVIELGIHIEESEVTEGTAVNISLLLLSDVLIERDFEITLTAKSNGTILVA